MRTFRIPLRALAALTLAVGGALLAPAAHAPLGSKVETDMMQLRQQFNADKGKVRILLVLSPSCPSCRTGARTVETEVFAKVRSTKLAGYIAWGPYLTGDNVTLAQVSSGLVPDPRVHHYFDARRSIGVSLTNVLGTAPLLAWDIYLAYGPDVVWTRKDLTPPKPTVYMNLKRGGTNVYFTGPAFRQRIEELLQQAK